MCLNFSNSPKSSLCVSKVAQNCSRIMLCFLVQKEKFAAVNCGPDEKLGFYFLCFFFG